MNYIAKQVTIFELLPVKPRFRRPLLVNVRNADIFFNINSRLSEELFLLNVQMFFIISQ